MTREYTFRDARLEPKILRALNVGGGLADKIGLRPSLDPDTLVAAAIKEAGSDAFGSDSYREPLERYVDALESEAKLSTFGRIALGKMLTKQLVARIKLFEWSEANKAAASEEIRRPWVILGLPRTGTSILSILLGLDPMARPLRQWEGQSVVPPATLATAAEDPRIAAAGKQFEQLHALNPPFKAMHPTGAMLAEECIPLMMMDLRALGLETQAYVPSYGKWLQECDMSPAYVQHKRALQALQTGQPTESWVLKTPNHLWCLETLLEFYPDARLIWTHRDPGPVTASVSSLNSTLQRVFTDHHDPHAVGDEWLKKLQHAVRSGMEFDAKQGGADWCAHVLYSDLISDPLGTIRKIYDQFGETPSNLHERRVEAWLREKPQTSEGRHVYDPKDFGWSYGGLAEDWGDYIDRFNIPAEKR
ncbi:MAG: sulfotransferase [Myxococcota bacterium]